MSEQDQNLRRAEIEVAAEESQLAGELARLQGNAGEVLARLQAVKTTVGRAQQAGFADPAFLDLAARVTQAAVPDLSIERERAQALAAREQAVQARLKAAEAGRRAVQGYSSQLSKLSSQLAADEAALEAFERSAREANTRRAEAARKQQAPPRASPPAAPPPRAPPPAAAPPRASPPAAPPRAAAPAPAPPAPPKAKKPAPPPPAQAAPVATKKPEAPPQAEPRREAPRVVLQATVDLQSDTNFFTGFSANLSDGGLFIATVQNVPIGSEVDVSFTLPETGRISARAVVRWVREVNDQTPDIFPGIGLQFTQISEEAQQAIHQFCSSREPMFYPG